MVLFLLEFNNTRKNMNNNNTKLTMMIYNCIVCKILFNIRIAKK